MKARWLKVSGVILVLLALGVGSYLFMTKESYPDTPAFQDEFTRQFLNEEAETPDGFHLFESWTHKYSILFPEDYVMSDGSYYRKKGKESVEPNTENVVIRQKGISPKENGMIKWINLFLKPDGKVIVDSRIRGMLREIKEPEDTKIEEFRDENKTVYYVENTDDYHADDGSIDTTFFYGFITDNNSK